MRRLVFVILVAALLAPWPAAAQEQSAAIQGIVKDSQGGVLPGVTVEARNAQGAVVTTYTDGRGAYRFPSLLPGRYDVTAVLVSFKPAKVEAVDLLLGQLKAVDFALQVAGVSEEVVVKGEAPLVDVRQSARATSITREQIDLLPKNRDFTSLVTQATGANGEGKSNGIMIDGATAGESRYIVDGAETSDVVNGGTGKKVLPDFVEEVQVKSSGYTAEYGGAMGGVINVITKSGSNSWRGSALFYLEDSRFMAAAPPTIGTPAYQVGTPTVRLKLDNANEAEYVTYPKDSYTRFEPGFSFGGPILRNHAWFFGAYQPTFHDVTRTVTWVGDNTTQESATRRVPAEFLTLNQTSQIGSKLRTRLAYNNSWSKVDGALPAADGSDVPGLDYNYGTTYPNYSLSGQADYVVKPNLFISGRVAYFRSNQETFGIPTTPRFIWRTSTVNMPGVPANLQRTASAVNVASNSAIDFDTQERFAVQADASWYVERRRAAHDQGRPPGGPHREQRQRLRDGAVLAAVLRDRRVAEVPQSDRQVRLLPLPGRPAHGYVARHEHDGRRLDEQRRVVHPGLVDRQQQDDGEPGTAHRERDGRALRAWPRPADGPPR